jgi:hypothetical protein
MARRRRDEIEPYRAVKPRRGAAAAFAAVTVIALAGTVYLGHRATAVKADERAFGQAQPCGAQDSRDCVEDVAGVADGPLRHKYKSPATSLTVSSGGTSTTFTFHRPVGPAFEHIRGGDFVALEKWRGNIVTLTAQGETENTPAAPSEQYRSRLATAFFGGAVTLVLAGLTLLSATLTEGFFRESFRRPGLYATGLVIFAGFATAVTAALIPMVVSIRDALVTAPIIFAVGVAVLAVVQVTRRQAAKSSNR